MSDAKLPQRYDLVGEYDSYMSPIEEGDYVRVEDVQPLLAEIERLRARVKVLERDDRLPRPPEELVGALNDRIHPTSGRLIHSSPIAPPTQEAKP
jgi:hypothetical protein